MAETGAPGFFVRVFALYVFLPSALFAAEGFGKYQIFAPCIFLSPVLRGGKTAKVNVCTVFSKKAMLVRRDLVKSINLVARKSWIVLLLKQIRIEKRCRRRINRNFLRTDVKPMKNTVQIVWIAEFPPRKGY